MTTISESHTVRTDLRHLAARVADLRDAGSSAIAASNALKVIEEMEISGLLPLRVDPVEDDALAFLFLRGREQITVECYPDGEIVVGNSRADPAVPPRVVTVTPDDPHPALTAVNLVAEIEAETSQEAEQHAETAEDRYERVCGEYQVEEAAHDATKTLLAQVRDELAETERQRDDARRIVKLAAVLIQPGDDGPQLVGARHFRESLMVAARHGAAVPDADLVTGEAEIRDELAQAERKHDTAQRLWKAEESAHGHTLQRLAEAERRAERAVEHGTEQEQLYWRAETERVRLQEELDQRDATLRELRGLVRQARELIRDGSTTAERLRIHSLEVRINCALAKSSTTAPGRPPIIASPFGDRLPDALRPAFAEAAQALQDACAALGPASDTGERCSEARITLLGALHDLPPEDAAAREKNTREEMQNIAANEPLWPGDTISHATADECVRRGWARRRRDGRYIATEEGLDVAREAQAREGGDR